MSSVAERLATVEAGLHYLAPTAERPRSYAGDPPPHVPRTTAATVPFRMTIRPADRERIQPGSTRLHLGDPPQRRGRFLQRRRGQARLLSGGRA